MNDEWKHDPRIQAMNPEKIEFLCQLTEKLRHSPKNQLLNQFLTLTMEAERKGIRFSDQETELLAGILADHMDPADRGRLDMLRMLSKKLASRHGL